MLKVKDLKFSFYGHSVLNCISFELMPNKITGLVGPSGGGKSVLLKLLMRVIDPDSGDIIYDGLNSSDISLMFQEGALFDSISLFDNIAFPLVQGNVPSYLLSNEERDRVFPQVIDILQQVGLAKAVNKLPAQLSGGMRRRASLARALVSKPKIALLDEPTSGLDPVASSVIMNLIVEMQKELGTTMLIVSQDLRRLLPISNQILGLFDGEIIFDGSFEELLDNNQNKLIEFVRCRFDLDSNCNVGIEVN